MPAAARSAFPEMTVGMTESKLTDSTENDRPSFAATALQISTSMPTISCPRRNSYGGNVASVIILRVLFFSAHPASRTTAASATISFFMFTSPLKPKT